jgi:hypothetical protein
MIVYLRNNKQLFKADFSNSLGGSPRKAEGGHRGADWKDSAEASGKSGTECSAGPDS